LRGAFKLYALQRYGPCISHQRTYAAPKHQHCRGLESDCCRQWRLPRIFTRSRRAGAKPSSLDVRGASATMLLTFPFHLRGAQVVNPKPKYHRLKQM
jgi:hypothetical protein